MRRRFKAGFKPHFTFAEMPNQCDNQFAAADARKSEVHICAARQQDAPLPVRHWVSQSITDFPASSILGTNAVLRSLLLAVLP